MGVWKSELRVSFKVFHRGKALAAHLVSYYLNPA
jgi:hypothetical protein